MDVLVSGSTGFIGSALVRALVADGHRVRRLRRGGTSNDDDVAWDIDRGTIDAAAIEGVDAVVHLAGEGIGEHRWTDEQKRRILASRTQGTTLLAKAVAGLARLPRAVVSASAIGCGNRGNEVLTETSALGSDFLSDVCRQWEAAVAPVADAGIRTVVIRSGIVLAADGGVLARMMRPFKLGLGGRTGSGRQYMSWIALTDEVRAITYALENETLAGPVNLTAPNPVTNAEFAHALGRALGRPTVVPTPLFPLKMVYGAELVEALLLASQRVQPAALVASGFEFTQPELEPALRELLHRRAV